MTTAAQRSDRIEGVIERDRAITRTELQKLNSEMPVRVNGAVDILIQPYVAQVAKMQAYLEQLDKDRPVEGVTLVESFRLLDANIAEMKAKINQYSVHTDGQIAAAQGAAISAAQGAAVSMPNEEVVTLNKMHQELEVLKTWSTTAATKDQIAHHERCLTFINAQLAGTNERLSEFAATHGDGVTGAMAAPSVEPAGETPPPLMNASRGAVNGGKCHCVHLDLLTVRVQALEAARTAAAAAARQPFMPYLRQDATAFVPGAVAEATAAFNAAVGPARGTFDPREPLTVRQIGMLTGDKYGERALYDDKSAERSEFQFDGVHKGPEWKSKMETFLVYKCPMMLEILEWAERHGDSKVTADNFAMAVQLSALDEPRQEFLQSQLWGFLGQVLKGSALVMFKSADKFNGLDVWRRVVRIMDNGLNNRLEDLRCEMRMIHTRPIKSLDNVPTGIAEFEEKIREFHTAGGQGWRDAEELKSDLMAILPKELKTDSTVLRAQLDRNKSYDDFSAEVRAQSIQMVHNSRPAGRGGLHQVDDGAPPAPRPLEEMTVSDLLAAISKARASEDEEPEEDTNVPMSAEELIAAIAGGSSSGRNPRTGKFVPRKQPLKPRAGAPAGDRGPRKCANCGKAHPERICPHPAVAREDRACWTCGKKNHSSRDCPDKPARATGAPLKAIEDLIRGMPAFSVVEEDDGWRQASQMQRRPQPRRITVGDFVATQVSNTFGALKDSNGKRRNTPKSSVHGNPTETLPVQAPTNKPPRVHNTVSLDKMTLDELDRVIKEEEANFIAVMEAEASREQLRVVSVGSSSRTLPSQGAAIPTTPHDSHDHYWRTWRRRQWWRRCAFSFADRRWRPPYCL